MGTRSCAAATEETATLDTNHTRETKEKANFLALVQGSVRALAYYL